LSIGSIGCVFSVLSAMSAGSILSALSRGSIRGWMSAGTVPPAELHNGHRQQERASGDWLPFRVP
jgi:hypothetical protein